MRITLIAIILAVVLAAGGCAGIGGGRKDQPGFRTGTEGLRMSFATNAPPPRIYDDEPLNVIVEVENKGATTLRGGNNRLYLSGFDPSIITGIPVNGQLIPELEGKDQYNPQGDYGTVTFTGNVRDLKSKNIDTYPVPLMVTACYRYETIADPMVCIDPDPYSSTAKQKVCTPTTVSAGSQAAPVAITSIEVEPLKGRTKFKINVRNAGRGTVIREGAGFLDKCSPYNAGGLEYTDVDYVRVEEVKLGQISIKENCKPLEGDFLRVRSGGSKTEKSAGTGAGYMYCEAAGLSGPAYQTPLRIKLTYNYRDSISKRIEILRSD